MQIFSCSNVFYSTLKAGNKTYEWVHDISTSFLLFGPAIEHLHIHGNVIDTVFLYQAGNEVTYKLTEQVC